MLLGAALIALGLPLTAFGIHRATTQPRPGNLLGMVLGPAGLLLVLVGTARLLSPTFFR